MSGEEWRGRTAPASIRDIIKQIPMARPLYRFVKSGFSNRASDPLCGMKIDLERSGMAFRHPLELSAFRFDIRVKYLYGRSLIRGDTDFYRDLYRRHLRAWNGFTELASEGGLEKEGFESFDLAFRKLLAAIGDGSFDWSRSPVPVVDGYPVNGAHRISACLCHNKMVMCEYKNYVDKRIYVYNDKFFSQLAGLGPDFVQNVNDLFESELRSHYGSR